MQATTPRDSQDRAELFELYRLRIEQYHFQVDLNWSRTRYLLAFNVGIVAIATGLLRTGNPAVGKWVVAAIFVFGAASALLSLIAHNRAHGYYRRDRTAFQALEDALQLPAEQRLNTTAGMRRERGLVRLATVTNIVNLLFSLLAAANVLGIVVTLRA